jgi:hypothetical protein
VKLTIAKWLTPDKTWIHKIGITPDVTVPIPANTPAGSDPVLDKALALFAAGSIPLPGSSPAPTAPPNGGPQSSGAPVGSPSSTGSSVPSSLEGAILKLAA